MENKNLEAEYAERLAQDIAWSACDTRRDRQARWDKTHIKTASCRLTVKEWSELRQECAEQGITVYALLRRCIMMYLLVRRARKAYEGGKKL